MKKTALYLSLLLLGAPALVSCNEDYAQPPLTLPGETGAWNAPKTMTEILDGAQGTDMWVTGYIVGWIDTHGGTDNVLDASTATFTVPATLASNILMAATPDETDWQKCVPVQLVAGSDVRAALNLVDNPDALGKEVSLQASVATYFSISTALKELTAYNWGPTGLEPRPDTSVLLYEAPFTDGTYSGFTLEGELPEGNPAIWTLSNSYGLVAQGLVSGTRYDSDTWAVSPLIEIADYPAVNLSFEWAGNYFTTQENMKNYVRVALRAEGETEWTDLDVVWPAGNSWTFVGSGNVDLLPWKGKKVQFGINYRSTTSLAGTLEFRKLIVTADKEENASEQE